MGAARDAAIQMMQKHFAEQAQKKKDA